MAGFDDVIFVPFSADRERYLLSAFKTVFSYNLYDLKESIVALRHEWSGGDLYLVFPHTPGALMLKALARLCVCRHFKMAATVADAAM